MPEVPEEASEITSRLSGDVVKVDGMADGMQDCRRETERKRIENINASECIVH